jgi:hypothetical protein
MEKHNGKITDQEFCELFVKTTIRLILLIIFGILVYIGFEVILGTLKMI